MHVRVVENARTSVFNRIYVRLQQHVYAFSVASRGKQKQSRLPGALRSHGAGGIRGGELVFKLNLDKPIVPSVSILFDVNLQFATGPAVAGREFLHPKAGLTLGRASLGNDVSTLPVSHGRMLRYGRTRTASANAAESESKWLLPYYFRFKCSLYIKILVSIKYLISNTGLGR